MTLTKLLAAATLVLAMAAPAAQASVRYDFNALSSFGIGPNLDDIITGSFSFIAPTFITASTTVDPGDLAACAGSGTNGPVSCTTQVFMPGGLYDQVQFGILSPASGDYHIYYNFAPGAFTTVGTHNTVLFGADQQGVLTVTDLGGGGPGVPEPTTWALMIAGFGLTGSLLRRRRVAVA